jgi:hypothetical protein
MRIETVVSEVDLEDEANWSVGPDGERVLMGRPLSDYLPRIIENGGYIDFPLPTGPLATSGRPARTSTSELRTSLGRLRQ